MPEIKVWRNGSKLKETLTSYAAKPVLGDLAVICQNDEQKIPFAEICGMLSLILKPKSY